VRRDHPLADLADRFAAAGVTTLAVLGPDRQLEGVVTLTDVEQHLDADDLDHLTAATVLRPVPAVHAGDPLHRLLDALAETGVERLPILGHGTGPSPVGWLSSADLLRLLRGPGTSPAPARATRFRVRSSPAD
jgi:CBS domain-containing protein